MARGGRLHVRGRVDARLLANAEKFCEIWAHWYPQKYKPVRVGADEELVPQQADPRQGYAFAVSGGLDSLYSLMRNAEGADGRLTRRAALGYLMRWRSNDDAADTGLTEARARITAAHFGLPFAVCTTNWRERCTDFFFDHSHGIIAAAHGLNAMAAGCVLAADYSYEDEVVLTPRGNNQTTVPLVSSSLFESVSYGASAARLEKMRAVHARPGLVDHIVVCHAKPSGRANCGRCEKCVRTGLELFVVSGDPAPILPRLPDPWRVAWMKPMALGSVVFYRRLLRLWPAKRTLLRLGVEFLLWRSTLQQSPLMRALKTVELRLRPRRAASRSIDRVREPICSG